MSVVVSLEDFESVLSPLQFLICKELVFRHRRAMLVGGAVRDYFLQYPIDDIDFILLDETPEEGLSAVCGILSRVDGIERVNIHTKVTAYRTAKIEICSGDETLIFDVVFPRKEIYSFPGAKPQVFAGTLEEDMRRRDFSLNALCLEGHDSGFILKDLVSGYQDLLFRNFRILHLESFRDDPVRVIRAIRFMYRYHGVLEEKTELAFRDKDLVHYLSQVTAGRRAHEFLKILHEQEPLLVLEKIDQEGFMAVLLPELEGRVPTSDGFKSFLGTRKEERRELMVLAYLLKHIDSQNIKSVLEYLPLTREERKQVLNLV